MQLTLIDGTSDNGLYLDFFQVYNWGIFDGTVYTMRCDKKSSLLTGPNGSGKTTLVDAFLSLLVPPRQRFYNQSAGSERKRERDEASYVLGTYGNKLEADFASSTASNLRQKDNCYSVLLACFLTGDERKAVTLMQMRFFSRAGVLQRIYSITEKPLTIEEIQDVVGSFTPQTQRNWKKVMSEKFNTLFYNEFNSYAEKFSSIAGLRSSEKALYLFSQTVGLKGVGSFNDFIRSHMFEATDNEKTFQDLVNHYEDLSQIYNEIEKAKEQIRMLEYVKLAGKDFQEANYKIEKLKSFRKILDPWYFKRGLIITKEMLSGLTLEKIFVTNKIANIKNEITQLEYNIDVVKSSIQNNSTNILIAEINNKIEITKRDLESRKTNLSDYDKLAEQLSLETPQTEKKFYDNLAILPKLKNDFTETLDKTEKLYGELYSKNKTNKETSDEIKAEFESLSKRNTNIPSENIEMRKQICDGIGCSERDLVFAGELLQVAEEECEWEGAIEKLLYHFALCILVPVALYDKVNRYVASHNLRGRVVYFKTNEKPPLEEFSVQQDNSVISKLIINHKSDFAYWIKEYINDNFDYLCTNDMQEFNRATKAITSTGLIKSKIRHEKDDRPEKQGRQSFVLGWNNLEKRKRLSAELYKLSLEIKNDERTLKTNIDSQRKINAKLLVLDNLTQASNWDELDVKKYIRILNNYIEEKDMLLEKDAELNQLEEKLKVLKYEKEKKEDEKNEYIREDGRIEEKLSDVKNKQEYFSQSLKTFYNSADGDNDENTKLLNDFEIYFKIQNSFGSKTNLNDLENKRKQINHELNNKIEKAEIELSKISGHLRSKMNAVKNPSEKLREKFLSWEADVRDLQAEVTNLDEYKNFYDRLQRDDLPSYLKKFRANFNDNIKKDMVNFKETLSSNKQDIVEGIMEINKSLKTVPYTKNPLTYIRLDHRETKDVKIKEFKEKVLYALPDAGAIFNKEKNYEIEYFKKIRSLILYLQEDDNRRKKVLDVRQWFEFVGIEYEPDTNIQTRSHSDSAGLSGGEKAKLTYTILASAIAYQYGITDNPPISLRLVIIDEIFSKVDTDNSNYAMELFKEMGLQLIVVTPMDKINIVEGYVSTIHITKKQNDNTSLLLSMSKEEYLEEKEKL